MIDPAQLLTAVIRPVLVNLELWSEKAERLILGTALQESECGRWILQLGGGPGLGIYQMETATHNDIWANYLAYQPTLVEKIVRHAAGVHGNSADELVGNLCYATAMCRVHYLRDPEPIPDYLVGQATYWKRVYNTKAGKGTVNQYMAAWSRYIPAGIL